MVELYRGRTREFSTKQQIEINGEEKEEEEERKTVGGLILIARYICVWRGRIEREDTLAKVKRALVGYR